MISIFPKPNSVRIIQATYFDNGKPSYPVRGNKTDGGKGKNIPQHMVKILAWTGEPIDFGYPDFSTNAIMIPHDKFPKRIETWMSRGTISQNYKNTLDTLIQLTEAKDAMERERTFYAPLFDRGKGQTYFEDQIMVGIVDAGVMLRATLYVNAAQFNLSVWDASYPGGAPMSGKARSMCRLDLVDYSPSWRTCS